MISQQRQLETAALTAERQIWKRAQAMSPQAPDANSRLGTWDKPAAGVDTSNEWSMSSVEALDKMQKTYESKIEITRIAHQKETQELRKENMSLKQRLKGVVAQNNHELRSNHQLAELQTSLAQLQRQFESKEKELQSAKEDAATVKAKLKALRSAHAGEERDREQYGALSRIGAVMAEWTRDSKYGAILMWKSSWTQQKPVTIDRAKVRALEAEAQGYRRQIKALVADVKEAMAEVREQKNEHTEQVKLLKREKTQLDTILSQSPDNAEAAVLRREILQLKKKGQERVTELEDELHNLKAELRIAKQ